jgi:hypothetical protein
VTPEPFSKQYAPKGFDQIAVDDLYETANREFRKKDLTPGSAWYAQGEPIVKNLVRKKQKGTYDHELAAKLWLYFVDNAAKFDVHSGQKAWWAASSDRLPPIYPKPERMAVARKLRDDFERDYAAGKYDAYKKTSRTGRRRFSRA